VPRQAYSDKLTEVHNATPGTTDLGTPLPGFKWVIKDMVATCVGAGLVPVSGFRLYTETAVTLWQIQYPLTVSGYTYHWFGSQTIEEFENVWLHTDDTSWDVRLSGYQLTVV
jgi:hypothetical protein